MNRISETCAPYVNRPWLYRTHWPEVINERAGNWERQGFQAKLTAALAQIEDGIRATRLPATLHVSLHPLSALGGLQNYDDSRVNLQIDFPIPMWEHGTVRFVGMTLEDLHPKSEGGFEFKSFDDEVLERVHIPEKPKAKLGHHAKDVFLARLSDAALSLEKGIENTGLPGYLHVNNGDLLGPQETREKVNINIRLPIQKLDYGEVFHSICTRLNQARPRLVYDWFDFDEYHNVWQNLKQQRRNQDQVAA